MQQLAIEIDEKTENEKSSIEFDSKKKMKLESECLTRKPKMKAMHAVKFIRKSNHQL